MIYVVRWERDEDGWIVVTVEGVPGCHTQGRTVGQAVTRVREALALFIGDAAAQAAIFDVMPVPS